MKKYILLCIVGFIVMTTTSGCTIWRKNSVAKAIERIDSLMQSRYATADSTAIEPGGAILIMKGDSVLLDKGYGYADLNTETKIDGNTSFNIASCSKQFTACAVLRLADMQDIDVQGSIYDVTPEALPYLPPEREPFTKITVEHLMSHSSGIPDSRPRTDPNFMLYATDMESIEYMHNLKELNFEPGTQYQYINPTYDLLYMFIEKLTGESFEEWMEKNIFLRADMKRTLYFSPENESHIKNMAHGYILDNQEEREDTDSDKPEGITIEKESKRVGRFAECDYGEETFFATKADGGIYTSTHEFAKWIKALRENKIISKRERARAWSPITKVTGSTFSTYQNRPNTYYGYGWFVEQQPQMPLKVYHTGDNGGFQIYEGYFPDADLLLLIFENRNDQDRWSLVERIDAILKESGLLESAPQQ